MEGLIYCLLCPFVMKSSAKSISFLLVFLFLAGAMNSIVSEIAIEKDQFELEEDSKTSEVASPGHVVFAQYVTSDNCGYCEVYGSPAHHNIKTQHPDDYVYISYQSTSFGSTATPRAGNTVGYNWPWSTSGAPDAYFGDRLDKNVGGCGSNQCYDNMFNSGGGMSAATTSQYALLAAVSDRGSQLDITIDVQYTGSGTAPSNMYLYAAMTEETCNSYVYNGGNKGHNCWKSWLMNSGTYRTSSGGSGTGFQTVSLSNNAASYSWSIPSNIVNGGISNALVIAALMTGAPSTGASNEHVLTATDSNIGPKLDLAVTSVSLSNANSPLGYVNGDMVQVSATATNVGGLDYTDSGTLEIIYMDGINPVVVGSKQISSMNVQSSTSHTAMVDTSSFPSNAWKTGFGARLTGLTGDVFSTNNILIENLDHDRPPVAKQATVSGNNVIERGSIFTVVAKGDADDNVDTIDSMNFEIEVSPAGLNTWDGSIDSGGENIVNAGTSNEGREYTLTPTLSMPAGYYDLRSRAIDSRDQASDWRVTPNAFQLANGIPQVIAEPVPTVICDQQTDVDMTPHISDPETPLYDLVVTSDSPYFVSWNPLAGTMTVNFAFSEVQGCPLGQKSILVSVDDGSDYSNTGVLPYGTLKFNVIENGQPRWLGLPTQVISEEGADSDGNLRLIPYITDTDANGQDSPAEDLTFSVIDNSNPDAVAANILNGVLGYEVVGSDATGQSTLTIRACDTDMECSDQTIVIMITPVNDAPVLDVSEISSLRLKAGTEMSIDIPALVSDVDNEKSELTILVSSPDDPAGAQYVRSSGILKLKFSEIGIKNVIVEVVDTYDRNEYTLTIDVYDSLEFLIAKDASEEGYMVIEASNLYIGQTPYVNMYLKDDAPTFTSMSVTWQTCNLDGQCNGLWYYEMDMTKSATGWQTEMNIPSILDPTGDTLAKPYGYDENDYFFVLIDAVDNLNNNYKTQRATPPIYKWMVTEVMPLPSQMDNQTLNDHVAKLNEKITLLESQIASAEGDTSDLESQLTETKSNLDLACQDSRITCTSDSQSGSGDSSSDSSDSSTMIFIIIGVVVVFALLGGILMMRGNKEQEHIGFKWADSTLPAQDAIANSMYGGTQQIFQQPMAAPQHAQPQPMSQQPQPVAPQPIYQQPQPVVPQPTQIIHRGPPLPATGLPDGWTMDQWEYYGQQYLDRLN